MLEITLAKEHDMTEFHYEYVQPQFLTSYSQDVPYRFILSTRQLTDHIINGILKHCLIFASIIV